MADGKSIGDDDRPLKPEEVCQQGRSENETVMNQLVRLGEIIAAYRKYEWRLACVLLSPETHAQLTETERKLFEGASLSEAPYDALWFSRPSHAGREAWELRLVAETPYALFETFEPDEAEEDREEVRREMEARLREYTARS
ncbi:MAG TPA: hypothetical protein VF766_00910 [Pyrinomonadaceae bacterium]